MKRAAAVAGQFYQGSPSRLASQVREYTDTEAVKESATGIVIPHAGLIYSGSVAGAVYSSIEFPRTFILLGPNHTGLGKDVSIMEEGEWEIPGATFQIDSRLAHKIRQNTERVEADTSAHIFEHSLEVQLPFIAFFSKEVRIVPITVMRASLDECREIGSAIADAVRAVDYSVVIAASTDMSHYIPDKVARQLDNLAIEKMIHLDPSGLYETVKKEKISMCGYLPATISLFASKFLGATSARLVKYMTSGDVSGDYESVVGYAGLLIK